jgi:N-acetylglucosaminyldiphosphoundecaprenol N-acetyl-beta-D-mannosaminyltransferase
MKSCEELAHYSYKDYSSLNTSPMKKVPLLGISISTGSYKDFVNSIIETACRKISDYACLANVHMLIEARHDGNFANIVSNANIITPDGMPLAWALEMLYGIKQDRVAGMDLFPDLLSEASLQKLPVYFYGGTLSLLENTLLYLHENYPDLQIAGSYSPPFRKLTSREDELIINQINESGARLVFVVLGCPKQERWMAAMKGRVNAVMVGIGGALPVLIGIHRRAPGWMQYAGLEWMFRLTQEPTRLFRRYSVTNSLFIYILVKEYIRVKFAR